MKLFRTLALLVLLCLPLLGTAHNPDQSYIYLRVYEFNGIEGKFDCHVNDINAALGIDLDKYATDEEFEPHLERLQAYLLEHSAFTSKYGRHKVIFTGERTRIRTTSGYFWNLRFYLDNMETVPDELTVTYNPFLEDDTNPQQNMLGMEYNWKAGLINNETIFALDFSRGGTTQTLNLVETGLWKGFMAMVYQGVWHIWIGLDHILFLLALILPSVVRRVREGREEATGRKARSAAATSGSGNSIVGPGNSKSGSGNSTSGSEIPKPSSENSTADFGSTIPSSTRASSGVVDASYASVGARWFWEPVERFKPAFMYILKIVTFFTIAHTITLSLGALGIVNLPSRWVESIIALSIGLAAYHNIRPIFKGKDWVIAFVFGLFHGFGFASVLGELGFKGEYLSLSLFGFNLGVELGQVVIILAIFPVLFFMRKLKIYPKFMFWLSVLLIVVSLYWLVERAFEINLVVDDYIRKYGYKLAVFLGLR
ncbi:MAG: HupE/UreJ family protein [Pricia sp.]